MYIHSFIHLFIHINVDDKMVWRLRVMETGVVTLIPVSCVSV